MNGFKSWMYRRLKSEDSPLHMLWVEVLYTSCGLKYFDLFFHCACTAMVDVVLDGASSLKVLFEAS